MNQPNPDRFFVYVANSKDGDISVFHLDAHSGALTPHARVAAQDNVMPIALTRPCGASVPRLASRCSTLMSPSFEFAT